jgi:hypothetical protein
LVAASIDSPKLSLRRDGHFDCYALAADVATRRQSKNACVENGRARFDFINNKRRARTANLHLSGPRPLTMLRLWTLDP